MNTDDWSKVQRLFEALCDLPAEQRQSRLAEIPASEAVRRQVAELLEFDDRSGLDRLADRVTEVSMGMARADLCGECLGPWRLLSPLGEGGMGEVYLAERADGRYEARVAVKFLAITGRRARQMFDRERRILARLDHPAIAHLLDAGEHPRLGAWLAMAYIDGASLGCLAADGALQPRQILACMGEAARAVGFAHQNLVLHRDLKPDHLLLTGDGQLKILDFGVATLLEEETACAEQTGRATFTLRYAAPEQILSQATTTRTDLYALGLILHELLSGGQGPFGEERECMTERKLANRRDRLDRIPGLGPRQRRDLDAVIGRCLASRPDDRYAGADKLAEDLDAVLEDRPVQARRGGWTERAQRWLGHHRLAAAMMAVALLAVVGGSAFSTWFALQARAERNSAVAEAEKAQRITDFMEGLFASSAPGADQGPETTVREVLDRGRERIAEQLEDQPQIAAHLERTMASSYMYLGLYDEALGVLDAHLPGESRESRAQRDVLAARIHGLQGDFSAMLARLDRAEPALTDRFIRAQAAIQRATAEINLGRVQAAREAAESVHALTDESASGLDLRLSAHNLLGVIAFNQADYPAARHAFETIYDLQVSLQGPGDDSVALALNNLGGVAMMMGDLAGARDYYLRALATMETYFGVDNQAVAMVLRSLGLTYRRLGDAASAERALARSLAAHADYGGRDRHPWREVLLQQVELLTLTGRDADVVELLTTLPTLESSAIANEQSIICRLEQFRLTFGMPESRALDCVMPEDAPLSQRAMHHYLAARRLGRHAGEAFTAEVARALELLELLEQAHPPDPLLSEALARL